ncbi:uncharacterized protein L969DRAFT_45645 [Mixia osmundae IAM 14324]|uniref:REJ domain-containing protein n=1 Tax=Mixia osmundae (strain CBS 9802 / IAM 14324 / JCM 22182 / KY 12970) TaxID=764103 RepID=G7DTQ0_MIXOS|nr:uncharacterized protein L969DRAFT_45645 [Mixia osmundae IAM 14324]KEI41675.1 hypothetical protein L969DRAFT_45645 [Mixia osmundae IAM 14324]GAA93960.1 hypothetical protein E5Q_00606 [Mixia osmundae IAM 14324]
MRTAGLGLLVLATRIARAEAQEGEPTAAVSSLLASISSAAALGTIDPASNQAVTVEPSTSTSRRHTKSSSSMAEVTTTTETYNDGSYTPWQASTSSTSTAISSAASQVTTTTSYQQYAQSYSSSTTRGTSNPSTVSVSALFTPTASAQSASDNTSTTSDNFKRIGLPVIVIAVAVLILIAMGFLFYRSRRRWAEEELQRAIIGLPARKKSVLRPGSWIAPSERDAASIRAASALSWRADSRMAWNGEELAAGAAFGRGPAAHAGNQDEMEEINNAGMGASGPSLEARDRYATEETDNERGWAWGAGPGYTQPQSYVAGGKRFDVPPDSRLARQLAQNASTSDDNPYHDQSLDEMMADARTAHHPYDPQYEGPPLEQERGVFRSASQALLSTVRTRSQSSRQPNATPRSRLHDIRPSYLESSPGPVYGSRSRQESGQALLGHDTPDGTPRRSHETPRRSHDAPRYPEATIPAPQFGAHQDLQRSHGPLPQPPSAALNATPQKRLPPSLLPHRADASMMPVSPSTAPSLFYSGPPTPARAPGVPMPQYNPLPSAYSLSGIANLVYSQDDQPQSGNYTDVPARKMRRPASNRSLRQREQDRDYSRRSGDYANPRISHERSLPQRPQEPNERTYALDQSVSYGGYDDDDGASHAY